MLSIFFYSVFQNMCEKFWKVNFLDNFFKFIIYIPCIILQCIYFTNVLDDTIFEIRCQNF